MPIRFFIIIILSLFCFYSFSQTTIKLGSSEEKVYPFELNQSNLYLDWTKSNKNFDSVKVFGMGEATHGTKEFFEIKAKTFEYLVTNCNYKVFGIEAAYGECCYINDYLYSGVGNIDTIMQYFSFWTWRTEEVKELLLWIREYNKQKSENAKISFYGFDMQDVYWNVKYFFDFLKSDTSAYIDNLKSNNNPYLSKSKNQIYELFKDSMYRDTLELFNNELIKWLNENETKLKQKYSNKRIEQLRLCLINYGQAMGNFKHDEYEYRDNCMAINIISIQNLENAKMFLWAHNGHITLAHSPGFKINIGAPMGGFLQKEFGLKYYSLGFVFNQGSFNARKYVSNTKKDTIKYQSTNNKWHLELRECSVSVYKKNTLSNALSSSGLDNFFVDIRASDNSIFSKPLLTYTIGGIFYNKKTSSGFIIAKKQFDGLIYISKTTRAIPIKEK